MKTVKEWMATFDGLNSLDAAGAVLEHLRSRTSIYLEETEIEQSTANALEAFARLVVKRAFFGA